MYIRCTHCAYDNSPEYRFCGMCGASLAHPSVETQPPARETAPAGNASSETVHGPSFLGLADDPKTEFHYLYEDETPRSRVGLVFFLVLMFGVAGFLGWQWRHSGFPFSRLNPGSASSGATQSTSPSAVAPAMSQTPETSTDKPADKPTPGAGDANSNRSERGIPETTTEKAPERAPEKVATAEATPPSIPAAKPRIPKQPAARNQVSRTVRPLPTTPAAAPDADLELAGERYLYGNGVPQNCARSESSLRTAALHGNSKAQTVLGTMYATGHCVGRDLPTAYRWFARALHQDPQNSRISTDLQVLWRQMSPQEKHLATATGK